MSLHHVIEAVLSLRSASELSMNGTNAKNGRMLHIERASFGFAS
jgi:hypothetical protein